MSSQQLRITLAGREHVVEAGTTAGEALGPGGTVSSEAMSFRYRDGSTKNGVPVAEIVAAVRDRVQV